MRRVRFSPETSASVSSARRPSVPAGGLTLRIGSPALRKRVPEYIVGRNPLDQLALPPLIPAPVLMTTKAGSSSLSLPRP